MPTSYNTDYKVNNEPEQIIILYILNILSILKISYNYW